MWIHVTAMIFSGRQAPLKIECADKYSAMASMMGDSQCESRSANNLACHTLCRGLVVSRKYDLRMSTRVAFRKTQ